MTEDPVYYRPPPEHEEHIRGLVKFLILFFGALLVVLATVVWNAQTLAQKLPFSAERRFVTGIERTIASFATGPRSDEELRVEQYVQSLADELAGNMQLPDEFEISVHLLMSDEINAFATLGGHLFVLSGLIEALPDENSLAMAIGHEIAHIKHRDALAGLGRGMALQIIYGFLTGQHSSSPDLAAYGSNIGLMFFSREQEQAADIAALEGLEATFGHVAGSDTIFRVLAERGDEADLNFPAWLSTHPQHDVRIRNLADYAAERGWLSDDPKPYPSGVVAALDEIRSRATTP